MYASKTGFLLVTVLASTYVNRRRYAGSRK